MISLPARGRGFWFAVVVALLWLSALLAFRYNPGRSAWDRMPLVRPDFAGVAGMNLEGSELEPQRLQELFRALPDIRWVRFTLPWDEIEPLPGQLRWDQWDAIFAALAARPEIAPVVVLDRSPGWARSAQDADNPFAPPHERRDFGAFAAAVARRYGSQIRYYQIWHEPNIAPHWGARPADPADYLGLLREAAVQIRAADGDAQIVLAALAPTIEEGAANLSDLTYLDQLYRLGGRAWFDVVAGQPYGFSDPPDAPADPRSLNFGRISLLRGVMLRHGDDETPLWATGFGWNALPPGWAGLPSPWGQVSESEQARYTEMVLGQARTRWPWLGPLFWPAFCPPRPADDPWQGFALCAGDSTLRPVAETLAAAAAPADWLPPGRHRPDHPALHFSPGWRVTPAAADPSADGDTLTFDFWGLGLALRLQGGSYWAYYTITVDGVPANALPRDERGAAYLVLHDPSAAVRWVTVARNLPAGRHSVRLETVGGWGQWALQGVAVSETPDRPWWPAWLLTALAVAGSIAWVVWGRLGQAAQREMKTDVAAWRVPGQAPASTLDGRRTLVRDAPAFGRGGRRTLVRDAPASTLVGRRTLVRNAPASTFVGRRTLVRDAPASTFVGRRTLVRDAPASGVSEEMPMPDAAPRRMKKSAGLEPSGGFLRYAANRLKPRVQIAGRAFSGQYLLSRAAALPDILWWGAAIAFALLLVFSRWTSLDLAALAGLGLVFLVRPDLSLPLIAAALPFWQQPKHLLRWEFGHFELFLWVAVAALAAQRIVDCGLRIADCRSRTSYIVHRTFSSLDYVVLALLLSGLASTLFAAEQGVAWREFRIVFLFGAVYYWLITSVLRPGGRSFSWRPLVAGLLVGMVTASLIGLWQLVTGEGRVDVEGVWRVRALYGSPNNLALVLDRGVPLALALALFGVMAKGPSSWRLKSRLLLRSLPAEAEAQSAQADLAQVAAVSTAGGIGLIMLVACIATFSKGALLLGLPAGIATVLIGGAWRSGRRWPLWLLAGLVVLGAVGMALLFRTPRFADLFNFEAGTSFLRLKLWQGAWNMALDHPILGVGPDNFLYAYRTRYVLPSAWEELNLSHPHNILLDLWTRLGVVGVAAGGWALIAAFRAAWRQFRMGAAETWPLALGLLAGLVAAVAHGLIDNSLFLPDLMGLFVIAVGVLRRLEG